MATLTCYCSSSSLPIPKPTSKSSLSLLHKTPNPHFFAKFTSFLSISSKYQKWTHKVLQCSNFNAASSFTLSESDLETEPEPEPEPETETETETEEEDEDEEEEEEEEEGGGDGVMSIEKPPVKRKRKRRRYRKQYPGEKKGITEEMRFVAMKFRNSKGKKKSESDDEMKDDGYESVSSDEDDEGGGGRGGGEATWQPSIEGFLKYLVDSKLVFSTIERIVDESSDVSYAYFRRTGLERTECILKDLEWFGQQGHEIPEPSIPGVTYANYLEELAEKTPRLFLSHFYNIYFSHIAGGQVIAKKAFERLLEEKELEFYKWEGDEEKLLRDVRDSFNMLAKHWSRDDKNKSLREVTKAFRFMGQIVRLIIL
ncbi:probable inactive heme oxygenase 2, chloroplastic [Solanum verrucosum]|uniref:probable inactive heme oxygenase 2, chloroplastic n=1 Tax=Solanum verrucosum TaxID=315347 RepID=UPI0020D129D8|nr:probable inactive heme oxygenase 2, chloroplastic [Solanum verrucosum]XP_049349003.1 probable inactive heme oxygenase 2, chloroplastic [Solanum verrucosum]